MYSGRRSQRTKPPVLPSFRLSLSELAGPDDRKTCPDHAWILGQPETSHKRASGRSPRSRLLAQITSRWLETCSQWKLGKNDTSEPDRMEAKEIPALPNGMDFISGEENKIPQCEQKFQQPFGFVTQERLLTCQRATPLQSNEE